MPIMKESQNYVWSEKDVLGQGATGMVYQGRSIRNREGVAVKTFNTQAQCRPHDVQFREFEVMKKLNHVNIVKMFTIEKEKSSARDVIVMELCTGGSLYEYLEEAENFFGLNEREVLQVIHDVAAGVGHLREQRVVHRDIKPGNIMRCITDTNKFIYKLCDFGAARELNDEEQFMSLYGTEEYLHPAMYEKALLHRPSTERDPRFGANVDLWSLGVTFYHIAAGALPFRPFGGRKNKEVMHRITTDKESGVISGVQHKEGGSIEWSRELPIPTQITHGCRDLITPLLAGLMETKATKLWTFEHFFDQVNKICSKKLMDVFSVMRCETIKIYINPKDNLCKLQELLAEHTDIQASSQILFHENCLLEAIVSPTTSISEYPHTSEDSPIFLFSTDGPSENLKIPTFVVPEVPQFSMILNLDQDYFQAKFITGLMYEMKRCISSYIQRVMYINKAVHMYHYYLMQEIENMRVYVMQFDPLCQETQKCVQQFIWSHKSQMRLLNILLAAANNVPDNLFTQKGALEEKIKKFYEDTFTETRKGAANMKKYAVQYHERLVLNKELIKQWKNCCKEITEERSIEKMEGLVQMCEAGVKNFWEDKRAKRLNENDAEIHGYEKNKLQDDTVTAISLMEHMESLLTTEYEKFCHWHTMASQIKSKLIKLEGNVELLAQKQKIVSENFQLVLGDHTKEMETLISQLEGRRVELNLMEDALGTVTPDITAQQQMSNIDVSLRKIIDEADVLKSALNTNFDLLNRLERM